MEPVIVGIATPTITQQCHYLGLLDVIRVNLVPPVTHLQFFVRKS